ncbi:MAG: WD40 repeat domain-containing protein [Gemmataceae bacterium]|nr:WD40 repeat domain-containing protein [Gemmataceae bacterium]
MNHRRLALAVLLLAAVALPDGPGQPPGPMQIPVGVRGVVFSPDGKLLATGTGDPKEPGTVTLWDVAARQRLWTHSEKGGVPALAFAPDGKTLALAAYSNVARLLDVATGKVKATFEHPKEVRGVAFSPDGKRLATACWDKLVRVWDLGTGAEVVEFAGHQDRIFTVQWSADGKLLLSVGGDDGAKLWDALSGAEKRTLKHYYMPCGLFAPDGRWVITGSYDGTTRLWDVATGAQRVRFSGTGGVPQLTFSEPARTLAVCGARDISLFELTLRQPTATERKRIDALLARLDDDSYEVREATSKELLEVGFVAEEVLRRAATEAKSAEVRIRARRVRQQMLSRPRATLRGHTDEVQGVAFAPDGKLLASGSRDGTLRLWDLASRKEVARLLPGRS